VAHPAARQLVAQRAQQDVGVGGGHDVDVRPAIVFLHGFTHTGASWHAVIGGLGQSYRALAPDIRGHGAAAGRRPIGFPECVADVVDTAPERFTLAGYSLGARLALHVALSHPRRIQRLVLVSGTAGIADDVERAARREADQALAAEIERQDIEEVARRWAAQPLLRHQPPAAAQAAHADRLRNRPEGLAAALRGLGTGTMTPLWHRLGELRMPATVVVGERDSKFRKLGERLAAGLPDADLVVVPAAGHAVHLEAPALVAACLRQPVSATGAR
jgi:2-succinyl-6-hydroxy-2,4-cyclohexadiene-1-carboxylate synthase